MTIEAEAVRGVHQRARMRGRVTRLATVCALACAIGCARNATTALLDIDANPRLPLTALFGRVSVASQPGVEHQISTGELTLPGTLVVLLPDVAEPATITLRANASTGETLGAVTTVDIVPHAQVAQGVLLTPGGVVPMGGDGGGGAVDMAGGGAVDLGSPPSSGDMATNVLAADTFHRPPQAGWGTASDGQPWGADANTSAAFSIAGNSGVMAPAATGFQTAALGPTVRDADVLLTASLSTFANGTSNNELAAMLRWVDNNHFYKAGMDGNVFRLYVRTSATTSMTLVKMNYPATAGTSYSIRFRVVGTTFMGKVWPSGSAEPAAWMLTATDNSIAAGVCGMRVVFNALVTATFTNFLATAP